MRHDSGSERRPRWTSRLPELALLALVLGLVFSRYFVGYQDMDDEFYVQAADAWLADPPFLGENHWHNRLPMVLSISASFAIFGRDELALLAPNLAIFSLFVIGLWHVLRRYFGREAAVAGVVLLISMPLFTTYASIAYPFVFEVSLVLGGYYLIVKAAWLDDEKSASRYDALAGGVLLAIAFLNRQTSAAAVIALLPLFLVTLSRFRYWLVAGSAFLAPVAAELLWYRSRTGNWMHRLSVDTEGHRVASSNLEGGSFKGSPLFNVEIMSRWTAPGTFDVHWLINPYIDFFTTAAYGLATWIAAPTFCFFLVRRATFSDERRRLLLALLVLALTWFTVITYVLALRPQGRYFGPVLAVAAVFAALGLVWLANAGWRRLAVGAFAIVLLSNLALSGLRERPLMAARSLAELVADTSETVYADGRLLEKAEFFLRSNGGSERVVGGVAPMGALQVVDLDADPDALERFSVEARASTDASRLGAALESFALAVGLPEHLASQFNHSVPALVLARRR